MYYLPIVFGKIQGNYSQFNFSIFHLSYSLLLLVCLLIENKTKLSLPDGNKGNTVFLAMWAMSLIIRSSYNLFF